MKYKFSTNHGMVMIVKFIVKFIVKCVMIFENQQYYVPFSPIKADKLRI